jgi:hypothetical protein
MNSQEKIARGLTASASEYLHQAAALEAVRPASEAPGHVAREVDEPNEKKE